MFPSHEDDGAGFFFFQFHIFLLSVSSASCSLRAFELFAVISTGTTGKTLLHCVSLIKAAVPKNNRTRTESKLMNSWSWKGTDKKMSLHLKVFSMAPFKEEYRPREL